MVWVMEVLHLEIPNRTDGFYHSCAKVLIGCDGRLELTVAVNPYFQSVQQNGMLDGPHVGGRIYAQPNSYTICWSYYRRTDRLQFERDSAFTKASDTGYTGRHPR